MKGLARRAMTGLRALDTGLLALRNEMTPGQRWTAVLAMTLTLLVLLFGLPRHVIIVPGAEGAAATRTSGGGQSGQAAAPPAIALSGAPESPGPTSIDAALADVLPAAPGAPGGVTASSSPPVFAALVRVGDRPEPGHDDASIAKTFLARAGITATVVPLSGPVADVCRAASAGTVVLAAAALDPALRDCLTQTGATVLAFDEGGDRPPAGERGQVVSTRRGAIDSLIDLGRSGARSGDLNGKVGLVVEQTYGDATGAVVDAYRAAGLDVAATAIVSSDPGSTSVSDGVRAFASKGVQVAVLAAPVAVQDRWVAAAAVLAPGLREVVSDAFDGVVNETYPPSFDGAVAHTSLRVPWFSRAHGPPAEQTSCLQAWQATATPAAALSGDEQVDVYAWCEAVSIASSAAHASGPFADAVRVATVASPLTSNLGPLAGGHWGPTQDAVLVWRASCVCWQEKQPFTDRSGS